MTPIAQFYTPVALVCSNTTDGVTYDMKMIRESVGWEDVINNGLPDSQTRISSGYTKYGDIDHAQMLYGDTVVLKFNGTVKGTNCKTLYAIVYTNAGKPDLSFLAVANPSGLAVTPIYGVASGFLNNQTTPSPPAAGKERKFIHLALPAMADILQVGLLEVIIRLLLQEKKQKNM